MMSAFSISFSLFWLAVDQIIESTKINFADLLIMFARPSPQTHTCQAQQSRNDPDERLTRRWHKESLSERNSLNVSPGYSPWTSRATFKGLGLPLTDRIKDIIDIFVIRMMKEKQKTVAELEPDLVDCFIDVSQSHGRHCHSRDGMNKCLCTSSMLYSYGKDRLVLPVESLYMQGYPVTLQVPRHVTASQLRDFSGEGMCLPCIASVIWSLMYFVPFVDDDPAESDSQRTLLLGGN